MINYKFFFESKRKKNRGNGLKIDLFITWHGREPREEQSWLVSRVQATALNESDALPPASVCRGIFLRPKRSSSWTAVSRGHYNWESYEKKENWKIFPISNFVINDKLSDWDRFLDFISFRKISPPPPILKKLECWRLIRTTTSATSFHTRRSILSVPCDIRDTRKRSHATRRGRLADCFLLCYYRVFRVGILKKKRVGTEGARWGERYNIMEWEERNAGKRTNEIATIEPHVSNIRCV